MRGLLEPFICAMDLIGAPVYAVRNNNNNNNNNNKNPDTHTHVSRSTVRFSFHLLTLSWPHFLSITQKDFVVGGTSNEELYGTCEALYRENMEPEDLFETVSQCLLAGVDRDCLAGWGAEVHVMYVLLPFYCKLLMSLLM